MQKNDLEHASIRPMRWWDVETVMAIEESLFTDDPWTPEMFWAELAQVPEGREVVVLELQTKIVGYASLRVAGTDGDINTIAVSEPFQGQGFGRKLMEWFLERFHARGIDNAFLEVRSDHERAHVLYEQFGFAEIDLRKNYYGNDVDAIIMKWRPSNV